MSTNTRIVNRSEIYSSTFIAMVIICESSYLWGKMKKTDANLPPQGEDMLGIYVIL